MIPGFGLPPGICQSCTARDVPNPSAEQTMVMTVSGPITYLVCPRCDRARCDSCNLVDMSGKRRACPACRRPIGIHVPLPGDPTQ